MNMKYNPLEYTYASKRNVVYGKKGMVCTSQPLAAQIGLDILKKGGNAIDAAIATAAAMTVLEPTSNGIGGDAFALVWTEGELKGLNASGPSPEGIVAEEIKEKYGDKMPARGWVPVTVPGAPAAWAELSKKYGKLPFEELLQPAIDYAENGYPLAPTTSILWGKAFDDFSKIFKEDHFRYWFETFTPQDRAPKAGEIVTLKNHAKTLKEIAETKAESFYRGNLADQIDAFSRETGGYLRKSDLEKFEPEWVKPISTEYRGYTVYEIPPNGHGITALMALNIYENYDKPEALTLESYHQQIEAMKLAFVDAQHYVTDPKYMSVTSEQLLSKKYAKERFDLIHDKALTPEAGDPSQAGTIYLCTADEEGNMVSFIQSNYMGFGSGLVVPNTGIALHNRGNNFSLDPTLDNYIAPGKKPYHTIIPAFLGKDGKPVGPFGVMGGFMQPQGHFQVVVNSIDLHMNPQQALDAPRWQWVGGKKIEVERDFPYAITEELARRGHEISVVAESILMGRGQIIWRNEDGVLVGATEKRADGTVAAW
jgi:gamma-glutamyltranspeptidase/glutathione hydrolase